MARGDAILKGGALLLDGDGNLKLSNSTNSARCCCGPGAPTCGICTGATPQIIRVSFDGITSGAVSGTDYYPGSGVSFVSSGTIDGTYDLSFLGDANAFPVPDDTTISCAPDPHSAPWYQWSETGCVWGGVFSGGVQVTWKWDEGFGGEWFRPTWPNDPSTPRWWSWPTCMPPDGDCVSDCFVIILTTQTFGGLGSGTGTTLYAASLQDFFYNFFDPDKPGADGCWTAFSAGTIFWATDIDLLPSCESDSEVTGIANANTALYPAGRGFSMACGGTADIVIP